MIVNVIVRHCFLFIESSFLDSTVVTCCLWANTTECDKQYMYKCEGCLTITVNLFYI